MERTVDTLAESAVAARLQQEELVEDLAAANTEMNGLLAHIKDLYGPALCSVCCVLCACMLCASLRHEGCCHSPPVVTDDALVVSLPCRFLSSSPSSEGVFHATTAASAEVATLKSLAFYVGVGLLVFLASSTKRTQPARFFSFLAIAVCLGAEVGRRRTGAGMVHQPMSCGTRARVPGYFA
jgi:hypothetical protein